MVEVRTVRGLKGCTMGLLDVGKLALITVTPTLIGAIVVYAPAWCSAVARRRAGPAEAAPRPIGPPIEQLAADLRRLLRLYDVLSRTAHPATTAHRLWSIEAAIGARAIEAAEALGVPHRVPEPWDTWRRADLGRLLRRLTDAGLVLPATVEPFTNDGGR
jgi:hypothetical protein